MTNKSLIEFIKTDLGCKCPEEVFSKIEASVEPVATGRILYLNRVLVGERLLIHIVRASLHDLEGSFVDEMFAIGKALRDENHYNRFRLVVVVSESEWNECNRRLQCRFETSTFGGDEKLHLHVIGSEQVPAELEACPMMLSLDK